MKKPVSLLEFAYEKIKEDILTGKYHQGEKLSAHKIAESLNISQTPIKEALNRLASEGFIEAIPRHGMILKRLSVKDISDMLNVRMMMEMYSAKLAVQNIDKHPEAVARMKELLPLLATIGDREYVEATRLEQEFHGLFVRLSENNRLITMYETLWGVGFAFYIYSMGNFPMVRHQEAYREHVRMQELLAARDGEGLSDLMSSHMLSTIELLENLISKDPNHHFKVD
jgi:DNA-binding GntR family transcriptional regulator